RIGLRVPVRHGLDVPGLHAHPVLVAEQVLQQDLHREGQAGDVEALAKLRQAGIGIGLAVDLECGLRGERIGHVEPPVAAMRLAWGVGASVRVSRSASVTEARNGLGLKGYGGGSMQKKVCIMASPAVWSRPWKPPSPSAARSPSPRRCAMRW